MSKRSDPAPALLLGVGRGRLGLHNPFPMLNPPQRKVVFPDFGFSVFGGRFVFVWQNPRQN